MRKSFRGEVFPRARARSRRSATRFFRPEVEATLTTLGVLTLIGLIVWPFAWGYEQRRQARTWQSIACAYRMREAAVRAPVVAGVDEDRKSVV